MKQDIKAHSGCRCPKSTILGFPETVSESEPMTQDDVVGIWLIAVLWTVSYCYEIKNLDDYIF